MAASALGSTGSSSNDTKLAELAARGRTIKRRRNSTIEVNGRKFDQVNPVECVDERFYHLLIEDLALIKPDSQTDFYEAYYNAEYAKTVEATLDQSKSESAGAQLSQPDAGPRPSVPSAGTLLAQIRHFWSETHEQFLRTRARLGRSGHLPAELAGRRKRRSLAGQPQPVYQTALANYRFLLSRLELLKAILLDGEEALIAVNGRVKKLNQVVGEPELQAALCACITSRGGRAALMLMNELFVDRDSASLLSRPEVGAKKAGEAARDTAEFCSYWYGDTLQAETRQREHQIKKLVLELAKEMSAAGSDHKSAAGSSESISGKLDYNRPAWQGATNNDTTTASDVTSADAANATKSDQSAATSAKIKLVSSILDMSALWTPKLAKWITSTVKIASSEGSSGRPKRQAYLDESPFSALFDRADLYADLDDLDTGRRRQRRHSIDTPSAEPRKNEFESRMGARATECAREGFSGLLDIGYDQNLLMYEANTIQRDHKYILAIREAFTGSFAQLWPRYRDAWSAKLKTPNKLSSSDTHANQSSANTDSLVDQEMEAFRSSFEPQASSYDRGAALGFTVGQFIGSKAAHQWPDPAELNTFTYDSVFLAGVGQGYSEAESKHLEQLIVAETAKRIAFTEANRKAFARSIHLSYLNGASLVPRWGLLHGQRRSAQELAKEGAKIGYDAALEASKDFSQRAIKFFRDHQHQRALAAPYRKRPSRPTQPTANSTMTDKWAGLVEEMSGLQLEAELNRNISRLALDCGQKSGTLMGALMGLLVTPEAFETYTRFRGSLEALEKEFNQYKLGAMRGYELGESWAYLNYTAELNLHLRDLKSRMPKRRQDDQARTSSPRPSSREPSLAETETAANMGSLFDDASKSVRGKLAETNTNNIFQFMVLNYGTHLVANHSSRHMLKFRSPTIDKLLLEDMKLQSSDLVAPERLNGSLSSSASRARHQDPDDPFEDAQNGRFVGELKGEFSAINKNHKKPIKFNIIDLGPEIELVDELKSQKGSDESSLAATPLTAALAKLSKVFIKFNVARRKRQHRRDDEGADPVAAYLNSDQFDEGDGYLSGTFSRLAVRPADESSSTEAREGPHPAALEDELGLEVVLLDELFERIEGAQTGLEMELVEASMRATTRAPDAGENKEKLDTYA